MIVGFNQLNHPEALQRIDNRDPLAKELKRDIGSAETQTRNPVAVTNHLEFCTMATTITWIYACRLGKTPNRRHAVKGRSHFAFSDVRRLVAQAALDKNFVILCPTPANRWVNPSWPPSCGWRHETFSGNFR